ncbi:RdgB/HAM1 family non-canonical purine NTP pyrophosphatase [SAR202 cluster bacterium AC-647-N09_OGT_505m]|nr:RdgB/HAM1 family non-canonical purine NTP pyrophosphatase [SAR202 cluster bacterium AC-647-N09_OGT_505m]
MGKTRPKLLLATNNLGKARELVVLLEGVPFIITTPLEEGIILDVEETGATFEENAALKARAFATAGGLLALADDSGLEVDALGGEPGPLSARYAGPEASDEDRVRYLLGKLEGVEWSGRVARFRSILALADSEGNVCFFEGQCEGVISFDSHGESGFGYDPVFYVPALSKHMAELSLEDKNEISHRGSAARKAVEYLKGMALSKQGEPL